METQLTIDKETKGLGMPWETDYGYMQAVRVGDTIYLSGQLGHDDEGNLVGEAPLDENGHITDHSNVDIQMRQTYKNARKVLEKYGATLDNVVEEVVYVTDMDAAFAIAGSVRIKESHLRKLINYIQLLSNEHMFVIQLSNIPILN